MVGKREGTAYTSRKGNAGNRVAGFQVALTSADLSHVTPCRNDILRRDERIVHPFADFVAKSVNILNRHAEDSGVAVSRYSVGLGSCVVGAVVAQDAAATRGPERVVVQEQGQCVGRNGQGREQAHGYVVEEVNVDFTDTGAGTCDRVAARRRR